MNTDRIHSCEWLASISKHQLSFVSVVRQEGEWVLCYRTFASSQDVLAGEADSLNEVIGAFSLAIRFCPFCGKELSCKKKSNS